MMDVTFKSVMCLENYAVKQLFINEDGVLYGPVLYAVHLFADASNRNPYCGDQRHGVPGRAAR